MAIVAEIVEAARPILESILTDYKRMDYEYIVGSNNERSLEKRYGFIPSAASFVEGNAMGFTTLDHTFLLTLTDTYLNRDSDDALRSVLFNMYSEVQDVLKELQKSKLALPTPSNRVMLIYGLNIDEPEIIEENGIVVLRAIFNIRYQYRNN
jgi:hypothetical protein